MPDNTDTGGHRNFVDDRHNLYVGWVLGMALRNGLDLRPVVDDAGNYTDRLLLPPLRSLDGRLIAISVVVPPPPDDWVIAKRQE